MGIGNGWAAGGRVIKVVVNVMTFHEGHGRTKVIPLEMEKEKKRETISIIANYICLFFLQLVFFSGLVSH